MKNNSNMKKNDLDIIKIAKERNQIDLKNLRAKDFSRLTFWHYTSTKNAKSIMDSKYFYVSNILKMNDLNESELFSDPENIFSLCFCNTNTEKIPMWYLYSGITGRGTSLGLTPAKMRDFILSIQEVYPVINNVVQEEVKIPIVLDEEIGGFTKEFGWVIYADDKRSKYKSIFGTPLRIEKSNEYPFIKNYPWEYEKEFRIVLRNKTSEKIDRIAVKIPDKIVKEFRSIIGPENEPILENVVSDTLDKKLVNSKLNIRMNLLANNKDAFQDNFTDLYKDDAFGREVIIEALKKFSE